MACSTRAAPLWSSILLAVLLWAYVEAKASIPMDYCASINTASMSANHSIYQSDGLCYGFCASDFALAIVQDDSCWCSNFVPDKAVQVATSQCNKACPGFPDDVCGADGLYGYMLLQRQPSGTIGSDQSSTTPSSSATKTAGGATSTTDTPTVSTFTTGGVTKTVTVTPLPTPVASSPAVGGVSLTAEPSSHGLSAGAAAGIAIAVVAAFLLVGGAIGWLFIKRRRARREQAAGPTFSSNRGSSAGMTSTPRTGEMSESRYYIGADNPPEPTRRRSTLMPVDPRLDPFAKGIYNRAENKSHDSVNTIRDDQDYSRRIQDPPRVLRAVNPDSDID
ncbi:hypothetical protein BR93DRAFT_965163 [Coniochaeta sp. PMI_546]|nr:hypothetical protein BR93DRAFT_965163 [Coniochaeta sp. PMI_546]